MFLLALVMLLPLFLLVVQAFRPTFDAMLLAGGSGSLQVWPDPFSTEAFDALARDMIYWRSFWRSLAWTLAASGVQVVVSVLSGYVLAKFTTRWSRALTLVYTLMMLVPLQMTLLPIYKMAYSAKMLNHPLLLYVPIAFAPFGTFFMRQMILRLPDEQVEYLRLEGGGTRHLLWHVIGPHCLLGSLLLFALTFTEGWNLVEQPLLLVSDVNSQPLSGYLSVLLKNFSGSVFAASAVALLPVVLPMLTGTKIAAQALQWN